LGYLLELIVSGFYLLCPIWRTQFVVLAVRPTPYIELLVKENKNNTFTLYFGFVPAKLFVSIISPVLIGTQSCS